MLFVSSCCQAGLTGFYMLKPLYSLPPQSHLWKVTAEHESWHEVLVSFINSTRQWISLFCCSRANFLLTVFFLMSLSVGKLFQKKTFITFQASMCHTSCIWEQLCRSPIAGTFLKYASVGLLSAAVAYLYDHLFMRAWDALLCSPLYLYLHKSKPL